MRSVMYNTVGPHVRLKLKIQTFKILFLISIEPKDGAPKSFKISSFCKEIPLAQIYRKIDVKA